MLTRGYAASIQVTVKEIMVVQSHQGPARGKNNLFI